MGASGPDRLTAPGGVFGAWCTLGSPLPAELMGRLEVAYVCLDLQHGVSSLETAPGILADQIRKERFDLAW